MNEVWQTVEQEKIKIEKDECVVVVVGIWNDDWKRAKRSERMRRSGRFADDARSANGVRTQVIVNRDDDDYAGEKINGMMVKW